MSGNFFLRSLLVALLVTASASALTTTWNGTASNDWTLLGNWTSTVPTTGDTVIIPAVTLPAVYPTVTSLQPASGNILSTQVNGGQLTLSARLNTTHCAMNSTAANTINVEIPGYLYMGGASSGTGSSHYWNAGTVNNKGYIYVNRNFYIGSGSGNTCTVNITDGATLQLYNQCIMTVGNGSGATGVVNIWGKNNAGTVGSHISNGSSGPRLGYNSGTCFITLKGGGYIAFPSAQQSTWSGAVGSKITSASVRERIVVTTGNITTEVMNKAYNPTPASVSPADVDTMTIVPQGTIAVSWTAPAPRASTDTTYYGTVVERVYNNFATGTLAVDSNGMPTDPNGDDLTAYTDIITTTGGIQTVNMTSVPLGVYQWRVDSIDSSVDPLVDPNYPITTKGDVWYFKTGNSAPVANAGTAQALGLLGGSATLTTNATITDDGLPSSQPVTGQWTQLDGPVTVPGMPVNVTQAAPNMIVNLTQAGRYRFQLIPYDTALYGAASILNVSVYSDTCVAAKAGTWTALQGDFNADCVVNGKDLALMVADWLRCSNEISGCN